MHPVEFLLFLLKFRLGNKAFSLLSWRKLTFSTNLHFTNEFFRIILNFKFYDRIYMRLALMILEIIQVQNVKCYMKQTKGLSSSIISLNHMDKHSTLGPLMVSVVGSIPTRCNFLLKHLKTPRPLSLLKCKCDLTAKTQMLLYFIVPLLICYMGFRISLLKKQYYHWPSVTESFSDPMTFS